MNKIGVVGLGYVGTAVQKGFESIRRVATYDIVKECNLRYAIAEISYGSDNTQPIQAAIKGNEHCINN